MDLTYKGWISMDFSAHNKVRFCRELLIRVDFSAPNKGGFSIEILIVYLAPNKGGYCKEPLLRVNFG